MRYRSVCGVALYSVTPGIWRGNMAGEGPGSVHRHGHGVGLVGVVLQRVSTAQWEVRYELGDNAIIGAGRTQKEAIERAQEELHR